MQEIARIISLNAQLGVGRQVFFCSLGGFDTHGGHQPYRSGKMLLQQISKAVDAFYAPQTVQLGVARSGDHLHAVRLRPHAPAQRHRQRSWLGQPSLARRRRESVAVGSMVDSRS